MLDKHQLVELVPHYAAMLVIVFLALGVFRAVVGEPGILERLLVIIAIVFAYRPLVTHLDFIPTPSLWTEQE
jgi:uncharacterized membrane protein